MEDIDFQDLIAIRKEIIEEIEDRQRSLESIEIELLRRRDKKMLNKIDLLSHKMSDSFDCIIYDEEIIKGTIDKCGSTMTITSGRLTSIVINGIELI